MGEASVLSGKGRQTEFLLEYSGILARIFNMRPWSGVIYMGRAEIETKIESHDDRKREL